MSYHSLITVAALLLSASAMAITEKRTNFDGQWLFTLEGDSARTVDLPHDWSVEHDFDHNCPSGNDGGYLPTGKGTYKKNLHLDKTPEGKILLYIEGAYMDSEIFVNGKRVGGHPYGYTSYRVDMTPALKTGDNEILITVDNSHQKNSRWYTGSGIYRHVWLEEHPSVYIEPWSMHITTPVVKPSEAIVQLKLTVLGDGGKDGLKVPLTVECPQAGVSFADTAVIRPGEKAKHLSYDFKVSDPKMWSPDTPNLYTARVSLANGDAEIETFGIRTFTYSADKGAVLNGEPILISGACVHHDNGIIGAASYDAAEYRKVAQLKEAGFNAVRTSHNPPAPAFLDACDKLGLLVIDESFDGWAAAKNTYDYSTLIDKWWDSDISSMVRRDRNHPSIIAWSIGNEIIERKSASAVELAHKFASKVREHDTTRPVTQALAAWDPEWETYDALAAEHDIIGYNYMIHKAEGDHTRVPSRIIWQTESYPRDAFANWAKVADLPYVIGDFVWTGIDYIGESGIGRHYYEGDPEGEHYHRPLWPWHNSQCGDIDITGQRKPISFYRQMLYADKPMLSLAVREPDGYRGKVKETLWGTWPTYASWNWPRLNGKPLTVEVCSTYPQVALYLNDKLIGTKPTTRAEKFMATFDVPYRPGTLRAVALDVDGKPAETATLETAGKPAAIRLTLEPTYGPDKELRYVVAEIVDNKGRLVPVADNTITFGVTGDARILATGSPDPTDPKGYTRPVRKAAQGRVLAIVRPGPTPTTLTARAKGLKSASIEVK